MRGLIKYYGKFKLRGLQKLMWRFEYRLAKWVLNKYKSFKSSLIYSQILCPFGAESEFNIKNSV